ncbi:MAG TPA: arginine deiminase-related protein [Paludibacter sp.]|nr:arginine deiminase-related protein [Paludibacter sp.]
MPKQTARTILMVEPVAFGFNSQTAVNNFFQRKSELQNIVVQQQALSEFTLFVDKLRANDINVLVVKDTAEPHTPDSIFPNNWISFHEGGQAVLYPMFAPNRRMERRDEIIQFIENNGVGIQNVDNFAFWEEEGLFLEGTGSMVLDRENRIAYAALSERTSENVFLLFCSTFAYRPVAFSAMHSVDGRRVPVYHTNVVMSVASEYAVVCAESIDNQTERKNVLDLLSETGKEIITISEQQMNSFAGNMLQVENMQGQKFVVMSQRAFDSLNNRQVERLKFYNEIITVSIPTIEEIGGGSVRCMMAEIF